MSKIRLCPECSQEVNVCWCIPCNSAHFKNDFDKWTSGNDIIDKFIQDSQLNSDGMSQVIEWIPYDRFQDIKQIAKGGFGTIYYARWIDGPIVDWDAVNKRWVRRSNPCEVVLKKFDGIGDINEEFLNEISVHLKYHASSAIHFYGITKDPETQKYITAAGYLKGGNYRKFLNNNYNKFDWYRKLDNLRLIAFLLKDLHESNIIHQDLHPGNILLSNLQGYILCISDFGLSKLVGKNVENPQKRNVFGVLPYIAPEVLAGEEYTKAADVYSFAMIAYEVITGLPPYSNVPHDDELALKICEGLRPKIPFHNPKLITQIIMQCWDVRVTHRPTFEELNIKFERYVKDYFENEYKNNNEITIQIKEAEEFSKNQKTNETPINYETHPKAIYTSRLLNFSNLPEPVNEPNFENELEEMTESFSCIATNDDIDDFDF
ncbi:hypothetical protein Glove_51g9 [Diversispora epigaea]|uniref:Protein kinase domain-containing protein n=1 Tax=Diversispora epigaea TaxID=1348612 RepID=A0A397JDM8_9GLOM|nr:hypothetical protein Glove_51g9 [Diversispora epigaea]